MNKPRRKNHVPQIIKAALPAALAVALAWIVWYTWILDRHPAPKSTTAAVETPQTPRRHCTLNDRICLTAPAGWINYSVNNTSLMDLGPVDDSVHIYYSEASTKITACPPNSCMLTVLSMENFGPLADTVLIRAVYQRTTYDVYQSREFLLSVAEAQKYGLKAGSTSDLGVEMAPKFNLTLDGKHYTQSLEVAVHKPGNYGSLEEAENWFDTPGAKVVHDVISTLELN